MTERLLNFLCDALFEAVKTLFLKYFQRNREKMPKGLRPAIEEEIRSGIPKDLTYVFDSGVFLDYLSSAKFIDLLNFYMEYKLLRTHCGSDAALPISLRKAVIVNDSKIIDSVACEILSRYGEEVLTPVPSYDEISRACGFIFDIADRVIARSLPFESLQTIRLVNARSDEHFSQIMEKLNELLDTVENLLSRPVCLVNEDFEAQRRKYHGILKDMNSQARIYLLDKFPFDRFYVPPALQLVVEEKGKSRPLSIQNSFSGALSWRDIFLRNRIVYLIGGAGYGKTLFTKKLINDFEKLNGFHCKDYLVICGELKAFYPNNQESPITLEEFLRNSIKTSSLMDVSEEFVKYYLYSGRCLILLDALDEVEKSKRVSLHATVISNLKNENPGNLVCITSRDRGFIPEDNVEVIRIRPLTRKQIEKYVDNIIKLGKFEAEDKSSFMRQSEVLVRKGFLNSFLVLSLLINIYKGERELPENKLDLYRKCFEYIANKREHEKTEKGFNWELISPIMKDNTFIELARLCAPNNSDVDKSVIKERLVETYTVKYGTEAKADNAIEEFLRFCSDRTELFVPTSEDKYKFFHRSFFEFFYSLYIALRCDNAAAMLEEMQKFDVDSEVFELTVAFLKQSVEQKYQALVELMLDRAQEELAARSDTFHVFNILILSMQVIDDALYRRRFVKLLVDFKPLMLSGNENLHNLGLIPTVFENDPISTEVICSAYQSEGLAALMRDIEYVLSLRTRFGAEDIRQFFDMILERIPMPKNVRFVSIIDEEDSFYITLINLYTDPLASIAALTPERVLEICKECSPKIYEKRAAALNSYIDELKALPDDDLRKIIKKISRPDLALIFDEDFEFAEPLDASEYPAFTSLDFSGPDGP